MRCLLILILAAAAILDATAQVVPVYGVLYRPPDATYEVRRSRHFDLIYQRGSEADARALAAILEEALPGIGELLPVSESFRMPVVLNRFTDRGNGYVSPLAFRQEIESVPFHSRTLSPRHASWFDTVGPHELMHAVHADQNAGFGVGGLVRLFAPDMARAFNLWVPPGVAEGAAVFYESGRGNAAGRLHYGFQTMQYRAAVGEGRAWSLAQALERPVYSRPTDRYYIGGGHFFQWLVATHGPDAFRRATSVHNRFPFFGYGFSLWVATGKPPWALGQAFRRDALADEHARTAGGNRQVGPAPVASDRGTLHRRPRWLDDHTVAVYLTGYARRRGLYALDVRTGSSRALAHEELTFDQHFDVTPDARLVYARYLADPLSPVRHTADLFEYDLVSDRVRRITRGARLMVPVPDGRGGLFALETRGESGALVRVSPDGSVVPLFSRPGLRMTGLARDPASGRLAVVANRAGQQDLYIVEEVTAGARLADRVGFETGSVLDASWSPDGKWIVLSADPDGQLDVFAYDTETESMRRLTRSVYGALEPAVSPDGNRVAYVRYGDARFDLVVDAFRPDEAPMAGDGLRGGLLEDSEPYVVPAGDVWTDSVAAPYRSGRFLRPRMIYPMLYVEQEPGSGVDDVLGVGGGLAIQGADPLLRWSYWGEGLVRKGRLWGEVGLMTSALVVRPGVRAYSRPESVTALLRTADGQEFVDRVVREERGAQLGLSLPLVLSNNVYSSSLALGTGLQYEEERLYDRAMNPLNAFTGRTTATGSVRAALFMQRNLRDLVPNSGLLFSAFGEADLSADQGARRQAMVGAVHAYLPWFSRWNLSLRLDAGVALQSEPGIYDLDRFVPRGYEDAYLEGKHLARGGAETTIPLWFVDDGLTILPVYLASVYLYGFGEFMGTSDGLDLPVAGGGIGLQVRLFYVLGLDLRFGGVRRFEENDWQWTFR